MEPGFAWGVWIVLKNALGCELDRKFVKEKSDGFYTKEVCAFIADCGVIEAGDTISIEPGQSEVE